MSTDETRQALAGCDLTPLDSSTCKRYLSWILGEQGPGPIDEAIELAWALAQCDDGVTWGRYDRATKTWRLGNEVASHVSPPIRPESLQELRAFGESGEVLIWRTDIGLRGRLLRDAGSPTDRSAQDNPISPSNESRILRGTLVVAKCDHGFTHIADGTGAEQVVPLVVDNDHLLAGLVRLDLRHYYEADASTGAVRIAATRLIRLGSGGTHGA